jgi:hypothetical protein
MSNAIQISNEIQSTINSSKSVIKTVTDELRPLGEIENPQIVTDAQFPYLTVLIGDLEREREPGVIGNTLEFSLPIDIAIYVLRVTNLEAEMDAALTEVRDIVEAPGNFRWNNLAQGTHSFIYRRIGPWTTSGRAPTRIFGFIQVGFLVDYSYTRGSS